MTSAKSYNDGQWHQVVGSAEPEGHDAVRRRQAGREPQRRHRGQAYTGYWRVGGDSSWSGRQLPVRLHRRGLDLPDGADPGSRSTRTTSPAAGPPRSSRLRRTPTARRSTTRTPTCTGGWTRPAGPGGRLLDVGPCGHLPRVTAPSATPGVLAGNTALRLGPPRQRGRRDVVPRRPRPTRRPSPRRSGSRPRPPGRQDHRVRQQRTPASRASYDRHIWMQDDGTARASVSTPVRRRPSPRRSPTTTASGTTWSPPRAPTA